MAWTKNKKGLLAASGVAALALTGAGAFTNSITSTNTNTTVGYLSENVSGANVTSIHYTLSSDGSTINDVTFVTDTDTTGSQAAVGFTIDSVAGPTSNSTCASTADDPSSPDTTWACTLAAGVSVAAVTAVNIVIS